MWFVFSEFEQPFFHSRRSAILWAFLRHHDLEFSRGQAVDRGHFWPATAGDLAYADMPLRHGRLHLSAPHIYGKAGQFSRGISTRWWFQILFMFIPIWGNDPILTNIFSNGLVQPPSSQDFEVEFGPQSLSKFAHEAHDGWKLNSSEEMMVGKTTYPP